ncbi:occlusion-derived virus envelope protein 56 [Orgyia leucostigma nucleopolyhedrovirus]|uniref:Occlusion-derived virus envelope protein 56 n=1 Tax=Orgyia leucostigma nucleopolyhedrovirus TaxID=490711 RepID=B0FDM4_9ABAC|nr:occlusion-derived virus envelope protein 56 [Orgyia leucostigma nucleopolyhedrovirus]ABY65732.1 occlusion-derived virus envelope protein 56 [Orgyia leucostigma nucleopolyhedrovirus]
MFVYLFFITYKCEEHNMSFFTSLRRVNKIYPNPNQFTNIDNINVITSTPPGFNNVLNAPTTVNLGNNRYMPGYNVGNNQFISTADINRVMRNNDVTGMRSIFTNANNNQLNSLGELRRVDNIPDANLHSAAVRKSAVKQNFPETATRTPQGVQTALNQNPNLNSHLSNLKTAGVAVLLGSGAYLIFSAATLIQDIIAALNRVGGSYYIRGRNGGGEYDACLLAHRTCRIDNPSDPDINYCTFDPLLFDNTSALQQICTGYNYDVEQTVCRASDPNADPNSPQYVDISDLGTGQTITCIEPYDFADLIGDLGLDGLLGDDGILTQSSNVSKSGSDKLFTIIIVLGGLLLIFVIGFFMFKKLLNNNNNTLTITNDSIRNK